MDRGGVELLQVKWSSPSTVLRRLREGCLKEKVRQRICYDPEELLFLLNGQLTEQEAWSERIRSFR